ncbi:MAG: hypothetical protein MPJ24_06315, partial [Pirellulaceae bacterium]|nr:hypothetical protein [Pirellulaceae bacterium]
MVTRPLLSIFLFTVLGTFSSVVWGKQEFSNWQQASQQQAWNQQASQQQTAWNGGAPLQRQTQNQYYPGQSQYGQEESFQGKDIQNLQGQYNQNRETQIELTSGQLHPQQQGIFRQGVLPRSQQRNQQHGLPGEYTDFNQAIDGHSNFSVQNSMPPPSP